MSRKAGVATEEELLLQGAEKFVRITLKDELGHRNRS